MILEILVPTTFDRDEYRKRFMNRLLPQIDRYKDRVKISLNLDEGEHKGGKPIGMKRNELLQEAVGEYVCFWDDDDYVSATAVKSVLESIRTGHALYLGGVDVIGIKGHKRNIKQKTVERFIQSIKFKQRARNGDTIISYPTHLNPVKRSIATQIKFPCISFGEDAQYADKLRHLLKTEVMINETIYFYEYRSDKEERIDQPTAHF